MNQIKKVSHWFRLLFQIAFILLPIVVMVSWMLVGHSEHYTIAKAHSDFSLGFVPDPKMLQQNFAALSMTTRLLGFIVDMIPNGINMLILYFLIKLFRLYEQAQIFTTENVSYIKKIGYTLLIGQLINPIYQALISLVITWHNLPGNRAIAIGLSGSNIGVILIALLVILISWIMAEGCRLQEEQKFIV